MPWRKATDARGTAEGGDPTEPGTDFHALYASDGSHPSLAGSYLTALVVLHSLAGVSPDEVAWAPPGLDARLAGRLRGDAAGAAAAGG